MKKFNSTFLAGSIQIVLVVLICFSFAIQLYSQAGPPPPPASNTFYWTGLCGSGISGFKYTGNKGSWNIDTNWTVVNSTYPYPGVAAYTVGSSGVTPNTGDSVLILMTDYGFPNNNTDGDIASLTINAGATINITGTIATINFYDYSSNPLTIAGTGKLNVNGYFKVFATTSIKGNGHVKLAGSLGDGNIILGGAITFDFLDIDNTNLAPNNTIICNSTIKINKGLYLQSGVFTIGTGSLTLLSSATYNAYIDDFSGGATGSISGGNVTVNRYIPALPADGISTSCGTVKPFAYHYYSAPVTGAFVNTISGFTPVLGAGLNFITYTNEFTGCTGPAFPTLWVYDETAITAAVPNPAYPGLPVYLPNDGLAWMGGWISPSSGTSLAACQGVSLFFSAGNENINVTGTINTGNQSISVSDAANGWNLVGNPYPSIINWNLVTALGSNSHVDNGIYYWDESIKQYVSCIGGVQNNNGASDNGDSLAWFVAPSQGFFVHANSAGTLNMDNTVRITQKSSFFYKTLYRDPILYVKFSDSTKYHDNTVIYFDSNATNGFDGKYDAFKVFSNAVVPSIYTVCNHNTNLSINALPPVADTVSVKLHTYDAHAYDKTLTFSNINSFSSDIAIYLEDLKLHIMQDLRNKSVYNCTYDVTDTARFVLHFSKIATSISKNNSNSVNIFSYGNNIYINSLTNINGDIIVTDILGREILNAKINNLNTDKLTINDYTGIIIVKLYNDNSVVTKKLFMNN